MRSATCGTTTPRELWEPSVLGVLEKLEGCMTVVLAMLKEVKEPVSTRQVVDQCSAEKKVEDPADELREMAESRAKAWLAENSAADAWMAELKDFEESRESSSGAESMLTCSEVELLTEERSHAGIVSPFQMFRERSSVRQGAEEPELTHLAAMVTGADMELDGMKDLVAQSSPTGWARLSELKEKADENNMELQSQREALDKMDGTIWDGLQGAGQVESEVTQLPERIKGEIRAKDLDATSAADTWAQEWYISLDERVTAPGRQLDEKVLAFSKQLAEAVKQLKAWEDDCDSLRVAGSRLQARTEQLEVRLDTEIEQLNDGLADLEEAGSAMRSVERRCMVMLKGHQSRMDAELVRLQECNMKASQKFDHLLSIIQGI